MESHTTCRTRLRMTRKGSAAPALSHKNKGCRRARRAFARVQKPSVCGSAAEPKSGNVPGYFGNTTIVLMKKYGYR